MPVSMAGILLMFLISCQQPKDRKTKKLNVIPKDTMVMLMVDLQIAESVVDKKKRSGEMDMKQGVNTFYPLVFKKYHTSPERFSQSLRYYINDLQELNKMYTKVINILVQRQSELKHGDMKKNAKSDTIQESEGKKDNQ